MRADRRSARRVFEAGVAAALFSGAPSMTHAFVTGGVGGVVNYGRDATGAIGELVPPFRPGVVRGGIAHFVISAAAAAVFARVLPSRNSLAWGAAGGLAMGLVNILVIGRHLPNVGRLPVGPQLADNVAFGVVFAAVADRRDAIHMSPRVTAAGSRPSSPRRCLRG